ncbi:hypothetical protein [Planococcus lenghuensis]|uniref:Uncharacterized protein n=1 Tax=Planococcus lenghuensis TaxID=2213202 RepID=A0A1Q2KZA3_9BACL|nr:hypothetical protein [Planococcus lenghuensis]AQQ53530.1 hypothetical protein B0X71_10905 [Planococcus lenghuensis]
MLEKLKTHPVDGGKSLDKLLAERHTHGKWEASGNDLIYIEKTTGLPVEYRWTVAGAEVEVANGNAARVTPDLHRKSRIVDERRTNISPNDLSLYDFISIEFGMHGDMQLALKEAAFRYQVTEEQAKQIYLDTEKHLYE